ncbi:MAG: rhomboid family intramembrane serine protease [Minicystis sp.]
MLPLRDRLPARRVPIVNYLFIALNVLVFIGEARGDVGREWALVPAALVTDPAHNLVTVFTSMFMHGGWAHIAGNMLFLWIFGDNVEDALGHARYLAFYLLSGVLAAFAQVVVAPFSETAMLGASGAIAGVLAAYGSLYPRSPVTVLNPIPILWIFFGLFFELPAWFVILEFFVVNLLSALGTSAAALGGGGVAFFAHLGGFVAGLFLVRVLLPGRPRRDHDRWDGFRARPRRQAPPGYYYPTPTHRPWDR